MKINFIICVIIGTLVVSLTAISQPVVTYPNGGEILTAGSTVSITWSGTALNTEVGIDYTIDNWTTTVWLNTSYKNPSANSYSWVIPNTPSTQCKVGVFNTSFAGDVSDNTFSIIPKSARIEERNHFFDSFKIFPNPARNIINIINPYNANLELKLFDIMGKLININFHKDSNNAYTLQSDALSPGTYVLLITEKDSGHFIRKKLQVVF